MEALMTLVRDIATSLFRNFWTRLLSTVVIVIVIGAIGLGTFYGLCVTFVDNYQKAFKYDLLGEGKVEIVEKKGYVITKPWVLVDTVDLRPMQVCINANQRVLNCKLVEFNVAGLELFLSWHGRDKYEGPGMGITSTNGQTSHTTKFSEILKSYAYDGTGTNYPFLTIKKELKPDEVQEAKR